ncbi:MAG: hypothetical protein BAA02_08540 [Paenibacillaceae bacterium ZCTH02-B3]|nr:MAG: hypothetical protein BAA02_08540 [Paenibacillaceae bacterium ZCTH02-B3]
MGGFGVTERDAIREEEESRLGDVLDVVDRRLRRELEALGQLRGEVVGFRQEFFDEVRLNFADASELIETWSSIKQQADVLAERERSHRVASAAVDRLLKQRDNPYFARIDFRGEEEGETQQIYIGKASLASDDGSAFYIYDWRAPICGMFYDFEPGPAFYRTPGGDDVRGEMTLKRQFVIRGGKLIHVFDTDATIGDEILQAVLSEKSDVAMKSIVATIQKEQNRIIRDDRHRLIVVQGAAGSGKTSTALQRIAWLLYRYRGIIGPDQIVFFTPNTVFTGYISRVLPDLGEANVRQMTFSELIEARLGRRWKVEDLFAQTEKLAALAGSPEGEARLRAVRYKGSEHFFEVMNRYLERLRREGMRFRRIRFRGETIVSESEMAAVFHAEPPEVGLGDRMAKLRRHLLAKLADWLEDQLDEPWVEEAVQLADREEIQRAFVEVRRSGAGPEGEIAEEERMTERLKRRMAEKAAAPLIRAVKAFRFFDPIATYLELFRNRSLFASCAPDGRLPDGYEWMARRTEETLMRKEIDHEDAAPLLYLLDSAEGFRGAESGVRHVFVDEAQDYSPFQAAYLRRRFPRARMTVLGDFNQSIFAQTEDAGGFGGWTRLFPAEETAVLRLGTSYRSTRQIVEFTKGILPAAAAADIEPFRRDGEPPRVIACRDVPELADRVVADIRALAEEGFGMIGVIAKTEGESGDAAAMVKERLTDGVPVTLLTGASGSLPRGVAVLPSYLAKGIEFDAVLVWNGSADRYGRERDRRLLYTVCTRALHRLHVYHVGEPSPFLPPTASAGTAASEPGERLRK